MEYTLQLLILGVLVTLLVAAMRSQSRESNRRLATIWARRCTGREWKRQFPDAPKTEIRCFLTLLTNSFGFEEAKRLHFKPCDTIIGIYQAVYPQPGWPDALEMETFALRIEESYGCKVTEAWKFPELTLGDLFQRTRGPNLSAHTTA